MYAVVVWKKRQSWWCGSYGELKEGSIIYCDPIQKANILNRQFISVFTDDTKTSFPDLGPSQYPSMEDITVSCKGVVKLLKNLKLHKAA